MVSFAGPDDFAELKGRGVNAVLANVTGEQAGWERHYAAAAKAGLRLAPVLWGVDQAAWRWNDKAGEWELNAKKYPDSAGAKFLQFLRDNPKYLDATLAVYAFHEPHNPETPKGLVPPDRQRKFWRQIHDEEFPGGKLKVYGESVAWHAETRNGCVDYDGWSLLYPFVTVEGKPLYRPMHWAVGKGLGGIEQWPDAPTADRDKTMANYRQVIDSLHELLRRASAAPDGSRTKLIVLVQAYSIDSRKDLWNRMPTADEMRDWGVNVVGQRKDKLAGMSWYCYRKAASFYTRCLAEDRKDPAGGDRWQAMADVGQALSSPATTQAN